MWLLTIVVLINAHYLSAFSDQYENPPANFHRKYSNRWFVKVAGGSRDVIENIATEEGFQVASHKVDLMDDIFFLSYPEFPEIMNDPNDVLTQKLASYKEILFVKQQHIVHHSLRFPPTPSLSRRPSFSVSVPIIDRSQSPPPQNPVSNSNLGRSSSFNMPLTSPFPRRSYSFGGTASAPLVNPLPRRSNSFGGSASNSSPQTMGIPNSGFPRIASSGQRPMQTIPISTGRIDSPPPIDGPNNTSQSSSASPSQSLFPRRPTFPTSPRIPIIPRTGSTTVPISPSPSFNRPLPPTPPSNQTPLPPPPVRPTERRPVMPNPDDPIPASFIGSIGDLIRRKLIAPSPRGRDFSIQEKALTCPRSGYGKGESFFKEAVNDPEYPSQWYDHQCHDTSNPLIPQYDLGVVPVWATGNHGQGVIVMIVDSGVETNHVDLKENYWSKLGLDLVDNDNTPDPAYDHPGNAHGTKAAGVAVMRADNRICGAGMAPMATFGAVRYMDAIPKPPFSVTDERSMRALLFGSSYVDIISNSWSVPDTGFSLEDLSEIPANTLKTLAYKARGGKGIVTVFAGGNGRKEGDHCGVDLYVASMFTVSVASAEYDGTENQYSERCASIMVTAYSGDRSTPYNVVAPTFHNDCVTNFGGTSAATPMVSGIIALAIKENKQLTNRDVHHLLAWTSQVAPLQTDKHLWYQNCAGFWVSDAFGFGLIDARGLTKYAKKFSVPPMRSCIVEVVPPSDVTFNKNKTLRIPINTDGCKGQNTEVNYIENVRVEVSINIIKRGAIQIKLISPAKTEALLLGERPKDFYPYGLNGWLFSSVMTWGEKPGGLWFLEVSSKNSVNYQNYNGEVGYVGISFHGTKEKPAHYGDGQRSYNTIHFGTRIEIE